MAVDEQTITLDQSPVFYRSAPGPQPPTLYLHGVPTSSDDWIPFLERTGGLAPDLLGFGRSGKGGHLEYSPEALTRFVERFLAELEIERMNVVGHDWGGAIALLVAASDPSRIERLVLIDAVPLLDGFTWHRFARIWRRPVIGELAMGATGRSVLARGLRQGTVSPDAWSDAQLATIWEQFDQGTQRAILRLYRSMPEPRLTELGRALPPLEQPALVVWGEEDPWLEPSLAERTAGLLGPSRVERIAGAGHWPWLDQPAVIDTVSSFLRA